MLRPWLRAQQLLRRPQHARDLIVHQLDDLLPWAHGGQRDRPECLLAHPLHEPLRDFERDVRLEQVAADLTQRIGDVLLRQHAPTGDALQDGGKLLGEGRKHKPRKLLSELSESKWWDQRARVTLIAGTRFHPVHPDGASTNRTVGTPAVTRRLTSNRRTVVLAARRLAQARSSVFAKRAAAGASSHKVYHTRASLPPPGLAAARPWGGAGGGGRDGAHLVAVAIPPARARDRGAIVVQELLEQETDLEF